MSMLGKSTDKQPAPSPQPPQTPAPPVIRTEAPQRVTVFGKTMKVTGEITSEEELFIDGEMEGTLQLRNRLTIGPTGKVNANIKAREVVVFGSVRGNVEAEERIALRAGATIVGDIKTAGIIIEDGAYFKGGIDISRSEPVKPVAQAQSPSQSHAQVHTQAHAQVASGAEKR